jgi:hypothetical protein
VVVHTYNPSTQEVEAGGSQVQSQPGLYSKTLSKEQEQLLCKKSPGTDGFGGEFLGKACITSSRD